MRKEKEVTCAKKIIAGDHDLLRGPILGGRFNAARQGQLAHDAMAAHASAQLSLLRSVGRAWSYRLGDSTRFASSA